MPIQIIDIPNTNTLPRELRMPYPNETIEQAYERLARTYGEPLNVYRTPGKTGQIFFARPDFAEQENE